MRILSAALLIISAAALCANRPPSLRAGIANGKTLAVSVKCVKRTLAKFGAVSVSRGTRPEEGDVRVYLWAAGRPSHPKVTVSLERGPSFTAVGLDAENANIGIRLWPSLRRSCAITDLG